MSVIKSGSGVYQLNIDSHSSAQVSLYDSSGNPLSNSNPLAVSASTPSDLFPGTATITAADGSSTTGSGQNSQVLVSGTPTTGSAAVFNLATTATLHVQVSGTWVGTIVSEFSIDLGVTWARQTLRISGTATTSSQYTANVIAVGVVSGKTQWRMRATSWTSGTATIKVSESLNSSVIYVGNSMQLTDATTSTLLAVKGASTAALATDNALVASLSPNSPLPAGSNAIGSVTVSNFPSSTTVSGSVSVSNFPATQPVSGTLTVSSITGSQTLPTNAAAETGGNLAGINGKLTTTTNGLKVDGSAVTQPVSGTVTANLGAGSSVTVSNLPATQPVSGTVTTNQNGLSGFKSTQQTITTSASQLAATPLANRVSLTLVALSSNTSAIWLGGSGVTTSTGTPLYPGTSLSMDSNALAAIYAIASSGSQTIAISEVAP